MLAALRAVADQRVYRDEVSCWTYALNGRVSTRTIHALHQRQLITPGVRPWPGRRSTWQLTAAGRAMLYRLDRLAGATGGSLAR
jgi:hypothetical protein